MIDHTGILVSDFERSKDFYARALAPLGYEILMELSAEVTGHTDTAGFGEPPKPDFWISGGTPNQPPIHVAFRVDNRHMVDRKSTRLNSSHLVISYAVFCLKKKKRSDSRHTLPTFPLEESVLVSRIQDSILAREHALAVCIACAFPLVPVTPLTLDPHIIER